MIAWGWVTARVFVWFRGPGLGVRSSAFCCLLGSASMAKSFLFKPLLKIFEVDNRPDPGSYQLETLLGKEVISSMTLITTRAPRNGGPGNVSRISWKGARPRSHGPRTAVGT